MEGWVAEGCMKISVRLCEICMSISYISFGTAFGHPWVLE